VAWTKWSYMDHWVTETPQGPQPPSFNRAYMDRYVKQLSALGFTGFDTFFFYLPLYAGMYGGVPGFERFLQDNGFEKITGIFSAYPSATKYTAPHVRETHDRIVADCTNTLRMCEGLTGVENFIVMPTSAYHQTEPVTDDTIKVVADLWNRVGKLTLEHGMKTTCHFEFWGGIRTRPQLELFFEYTDPQYVHFFCDTAQHTIAGVDPVQMFRDYADRCTGFHFKDTKNVDEHEAYRTPPDPELMAPQVTRWFYEMGEGGLVDFPALMKEIVTSGYDGWLTVEHDKAELGGGSYAEATAVAKWYIDNVLAQAHDEALAEARSELEVGR
jgi:inosose dehydratase